MGRLYAYVGVTGPDEFGELPLTDQVFWIKWLDEHNRRQRDDNDEDGITIPEGFGELKQGI